MQLLYVFFFSPPLLSSRRIANHSFPPPTLVLRFKLILFYFASSVERGRKKHLGAPGPCSHTQHIFRLGHPFMSSLFRWADRPQRGITAVTASIIHILSCITEAGLFMSAWHSVTCYNKHVIMSTTKSKNNIYIYITFHVNWCPPDLKRFSTGTLIFPSCYISTSLS